ncbi:MAG TPA: TIGR03557 family F420-dependent LLM class oxidoreductase [Thermomicrobiales bacterium]|nr:TIGR03557 family F420-dependent LLM class oxidoreductase [Thermomicrobiales bacterium]
MTQGVVGYAASFEQFHPNELLAYSQQAEQQGFGAVMASDHFHPWVPSQGHSAFVWTWLGSLGTATSIPKFGTGVTPPGYRYHPAVLAQAAATVEAMFPGRFFLGLGAGEALNEHIVGEYWPEAPIRLERLMESIEIIERLFEGKVVKHQGKHFRVESAKLYTLPEKAPPIYVATSGPIMAKRTGKHTDGIITVGAADEKLKMLMDRFEKGAQEAGKDPKSMPRMLQIKVSYADTDEEAIDSAVRDWPNGGMSFPKADVRNPDDFEAMAKLVRPENFKNRVLTSSDLDAHVEYIQRFIDLGFGEIYVHNVNRDQEKFIDAYGKHVIPNLNWK